HSRESLDFFYRAAEHPLCCEWRSAGPKRVIRKITAQRLIWAGTSGHRRSLLDDYSLEAGHIRSLGLNPLVVLTDHDDLEAPMSLRAVNARRTVPVSVE